MRDLSQGQPWWAAMEKDLWPEGLEDDLKNAGLWQEPHGDRAQELVVIGKDLDRPAVEARLDACLLTEDEFAMPLPWAFNDTLPDWEGESAEDGHGHGHDH